MITKRPYIVISMLLPVLGFLLLLVMLIELPISTTLCALVHICFLFFVLGLGVVIFNSIAMVIGAIFGNCALCLNYNSYSRVSEAMELDIEEGAELEVKDSAIFGSFLLHIINTIAALETLVVSAVCLYNATLPIYIVGVVFGALFTIQAGFSVFKTAPPALATCRGE